MLARIAATTYIISYYVILYYIILHYITLYHIILHYITLHYITLHYIILHYITLYYIISHYITFYYIILHYITLYYIILHYIILHCKFYCISWQHILKTRQSFLKTYTRSFIYQSNLHLDCIARKLRNGSKLHVTATNHTYESFGTSSVYNSGYSYHDEQKHAGN